MNFGVDLVKTRPAPLRAQVDLREEVLEAIAKGGWRGSVFKVVRDSKPKSKSDHELLKQSKHLRYPQMTPVGRF